MNNSSQEINILIVDDTPEHIQIAGTILKELGYTIRAATSGRQALTLIEKQIPTLILLDISMEGLDGFEVCRQIKENPLCQDTAIIFVTAADDEESLQKGFLSGAQDYVTKPFSAAELISRVSAHIRIAVQSKELKQAYDDLDQFCHTVSHDLKSPLLVIRQLIHLLSEDLSYNLSQSDREIITHLSGKCNHTIQMIERLLEFSKMSQIECHCVPVDLTRIFSQVLHELCGLEPERKIDIHMDVLPVILADPALISLLAQNIFGNALKFTRHRSPAVITVTCEQNTREIIIRIQDNGAGFDMDYSDRLFHVFERLHTEDEFEGTGVGLAIVSRIMKSHNGSVEISGKVDEGALVTLHFPH